MAHIDPVTGDSLTSLEYLTRQVQTVVRSPWFILVFNLITLAALALHHMDDWNYLASWLAIMVEWVVGTFMFGQTARDAVLMRRIAKLVEHIDAEETRLLHDLEDTSSSMVSYPIAPPESQKTSPF